MSDLRDLDDSATVDEVLTRSAGGRREWDNVVAACYRCNTHRRSMNAWKFYALVSGRRKIGPGKERGRHNGVLAYLAKIGRGPWAKEESVDAN